MFAVVSAGSRWAITWQLVRITWAAILTKVRVTQGSSTDASVEIRNKPIVTIAPEFRYATRCIVGAPIWFRKIAQFYTPFYYMYCNIQIKNIAIVIIAPEFRHTARCIVGAPIWLTESAQFYTPFFSFNWNIQIENIAIVIIAPEFRHTIRCIVGAPIWIMNIAPFYL